MDDILLAHSDISFLERMLDEVKKKKVQKQKTPCLAEDCKSLLKNTKKGLIILDIEFAYKRLGHKRYKSEETN